jgi:hydroxyacylglutathione hydrolase
LRLNGSHKGAGIVADLNVTWIHGAPDCSLSTDPPIQVHRFDRDTFILRQSKCSEPGTPAAPGPSLEAPCMYLLIGKSRALLLDSGASRSPAIFPLASTVQKILNDHAADVGGQAVPLLVAHSHSHGDHHAADEQFAGMPGATVAPLTLPKIMNFFGLASWPDATASLDLGSRIVDIMPIPGHHETPLAFYDRNSELLLTGDTVYPGLLVVRDWKAYVGSIARLASFAAAHPVSFILGAHIEMTKHPRRWFGLEVLFQPDEHVLQLTHSHLKELNAALQAMGSNPRTDRHADFIIYPAGAPMPALSP